MLLPHGSLIARVPDLKGTFKLPMEVSGQLLSARLALKLGHTVAGHGASRSWHLDASGENEYGQADGKGGGETLIHFHH